jgi:hypothetical protein
MSDGTVLAPAVITRLESEAEDTDVTVLDSTTLDAAEDVPDGPFLIFWDAADLVSSDRLDGTPNRYRWGFYLICGGRRPDQMRWAVKFARDALAGWWVGDEGALVEILNGAPEIEDSSVPSDIRNTRTLEYRLYTNWS